MKLIEQYNLTNENLNKSLKLFSPIKLVLTKICLLLSKRISKRVNEKTV